MEVIERNSKHEIYLALYLSNIRIAARSVQRDGNFLVKLFLIIQLLCVWVMCGDDKNPEFRASWISSAVVLVRRTSSMGRWLVSGKNEWTWSVDVYFEFDFEPPNLKDIKNVHAIPSSISSPLYHDMGKLTLSISNNCLVFTSVSYSYHIIGSALG